MTDETRSAARKHWRCRLLGCDKRIISDPRPRDYGLHGKPILRKAPTQCVRCGEVKYG